NTDNNKELNHIKSLTIALAQKRKRAVLHSLKRKTLERQLLDNKKNKDLLEMQPKKKKNNIKAI
ncbi:22992_t:CDS:2, partial [Cetraspora pellucida]